MRPHIAKRVSNIGLYYWCVYAYKGDETPIGIYDTMLQAFAQARTILQ